MPENLLAGLRVVEISTWLAAPVTGFLLAEAGADVVKVESPRGDPARASAGFATWNRSKRGVVLDLATDDGRRSLHELIGGADVLLHSLRPSRAGAWGLDDDALAAYEGLIWCSIRGWPHGHPDEDRPGYEILADASTGVMDEELGNRPGPIFPRFPYASWNAAFLATIGILARLRTRDLDGRGGPVRTSLVQGSLAPMSKHWARADHPTESMSYANLVKGGGRVMVAGDGLGMVASSQGQDPVEALDLFREIVAELGPSAPHDPEELRRLVLRSRPREQWLVAMWAAEMPVVPVGAHIGVGLADEQARANDYAIELDDPVWGRVFAAGHPFRVDPPLAVVGPAPRLGEHTDQVLAGGWAAPRRTSTPSSAQPVSRPLEGLNVLDFGMFLAGPYGPQLMADLGAELVKVEATTGDRLRRIERVFAGCNRGKRSLAIDLRDPATKPVLAQLVEWADVVHHNLRMPAARRLGLDYESVRAMKPSIVYCHVSSYGPEGPRRDWAGVDPTSQAVVGWMQEGAGPGNPARWLRIGMTDDQCAMLSVVAVLLALRHRDRTGEGMDVRGSILGGAVLTTSETLLLADGTYAPYAHMDAGETGLGPGYRIYECNGGWVAVVALGDEQRARLRDATGASDDDEIAARIRTRAPENVASALEAVGIPAEVVRVDHEGAFFDSELNRTLGLTVAYEHVEYGETEQIGALWDFGDQSLRLDRPPPALGQHTAEILAEIGVDDATVASLAGSGLVAGPGLPKR